MSFYNGNLKPDGAKRSFVGGDSNMTSDEIAALMLNLNRTDPHAGQQASPFPSSSQPQAGEKREAPAKSISFQYPPRQQDLVARLREQRNYLSSSSGKSSPSEGGVPLEYGSQHSITSTISNVSRPKPDKTAAYGSSSQAEQLLRLLQSSRGPAAAPPAAAQLSTELMNLISSNASAMPQQQQHQQSSLRRPEAASTIPPLSLQQQQQVLNLLQGNGALGILSSALPNTLSGTLALLQQLQQVQTANQQPSGYSQQQEQQQQQQHPQASKISYSTIPTPSPKICVRPAVSTPPTDGRGIHTSSAGQLSSNSGGPHPPVAALSASNHLHAGRSNENMILPCRARGMPSDHNFEVRIRLFSIENTIFVLLPDSLTLVFFYEFLKNAHFEIPATVRHGEELLCSYDTCRHAGVKFRYCAVCHLPVAKRNFHQRHSHGQQMYTSCANPAMLLAESDAAPKAKLSKKQKKLRKKNKNKEQRRLSNDGGGFTTGLADHATSRPGIATDTDGERKPPGEFKPPPNVENEISFARQWRWASLLGERPKSKDSEKMSAWLAKVIAASYLHHATSSSSGTTSSLTESSSAGEKIEENAMGLEDGGLKRSVDVAKMDQHQEQDEKRSKKKKRRRSKEKRSSSSMPSSRKRKLSRSLPEDNNATETLKNKSSSSRDKNEYKNASKKKRRRSKEELSHSHSKSAGAAIGGTATSKSEDIEDLSELSGSFAEWKDRKKKRVAAAALLEHHSSSMVNKTAGENKAGVPTTF